MQVTCKSRKCNLDKKWLIAFYVYVELGAVYVFITFNNGITRTQTQKLLASDGAPGDEFGWAVAFNGNTIVVGVRFNGNSNGAAAGKERYIYTPCIVQ